MVICSPGSRRAKPLMSSSVSSPRMAISFSALNRSSSISMGVPAASPAASLEVPAAASLRVGAISSQTAGYRLAVVWAV